MITRIFSISLLCCFIGTAQAQSPVAGLAGSPMRMGFGAEGMGFGNALVASRSNIRTGYYNPALLPFQSRPVASISTGFLSLDRKLNFLSFSQNIEPSGGISLGIINAGVSEIEERDRDGNKLGTLSTSENAFFLSFGVLITEYISIGVSTKILYYHLYSGISSTTVGFDIGAAVLVSDEWTIGTSIQDIGSKYKWDTSKLYGLSGNVTTDRFPVRWKLGLCYSPISVPLNLSAEVEHIAKTLLFRFGASLDLVDAITIRTGIDQISPSDEIVPKPSLGFTTRTEIRSLTVFLSYAYVIEPYSPYGIHFVTAGLQL